MSNTKLRCPNVSLMSTFDMPQLKLKMLAFLTSWKSEILINILCLFLLAEDIIWVHVQSQNFSNVSHTHVEYAYCWLAPSGHQWSILLPTMLHNDIFMCVVTWRRWKHCCHEKHGSRTCRTEMITPALKSQDSTLQGSFTNTITARSPDQRMPAGWWLSAASSLYWLLHSDWFPRTGRWPDLQPL